MYEKLWAPGRAFWVTILVLMTCGTIAAGVVLWSGLFWLIHHLKIR